jgi:DMSO/TMAO reductase YedYZ molybdopterin-dependent catalytic subunit
MLLDPRSLILPFRRKEENMLKKSIGFNWGPCAVSTSYWTGVPLRDLLIRAGAKGPANVSS